MLGFDFDPRLNTNTVNINTLRPFVGLADITQFNSGLSSNYHSFQSMVQRRFGEGCHNAAQLYEIPIPERATA